MKNTTKYLILLPILLFYSEFAKADLDVEYNLVTSHFFETCKVAENFSNKAFDCGKGITNPIFGLKDRKTGFRSFMGINSVGGFMGGASKTIDGLVIGAYLQDMAEFDKRELAVLTSVRFGSVGIMPVVGYELELSSKDYKVFSIITPALATLGIGFKY